MPATVVPLSDLVDIKSAFSNKYSQNLDKWITVHCMQHLSLYVDNLIHKTSEQSTISLMIQAWRGRKRQARGHHSPPIQGEWWTIDDQKNILASLCLASYLIASWLQKLKTKHCLLRKSYFCSYVCVWYLSLIYL